MTNSPEEGVRCAAIIMGDAVAHLQAQAQVHLISHTQGQADRCHRIWLRTTHQALGELVGERVLHTPLWNLQENSSRGEYSSMVGQGTSRAR